MVLAIALAAFLYLRLDEESQRLCEAALNKHCEPFVARVGSAQYTPGRGVTMYDVEIVEQLPWRSPRGILQVEELHVEGKFDVANLMRGKPVITRIVAKTARLAATRRKDGTWNVADFRPKPSEGPLPRVEVRDATVLLASESGGADRTIGVHHIDATLAPSAEAPGRVEFNVTARDTLANALELRGNATRDASGLRVDYKVEGLPLSKKLLTSLVHYRLIKPFPLPIRGQVSVEGHVAQTSDQPLDWQAAFQLDGGEITVPGVKRPLSAVALGGEARADGLRLDRCQANWGDATIRAAGTRRGWGFFSPVALRCQIDDFDVASMPVAMLPDSAAKLWQRFRPLGRADVSADVVFDGRTWAPRATITTNNASFEDAEKFPYRLANGSGRILINGGTTEQPAATPPTGGMTLDVNLRGDADGAPILITAAFREIALRNRSNQPRPPMPMGWVEISGNGIPISQRLIAAVPEDGARDFITSLHPTGKIDVQWRAERDNPEVRSPELALKMRLNNCRMLYDRFPYPLDNVTGWVEQRDKNWRFYELRSRDTQGRTVVAGAGSLEPSEDSCRFDLRLQGEATALNRTLFDALPDNAQQAWTFLRPRGQIDFVADISRECGQPLPAVRLAMTPHERNLAIEPPLSASGNRYRLERLDGEFDWSNDRLTIKNARAEHGRTNYTTDGSFESRLNGAWKLDLQGLNADRLSFDRDFLIAAPPELRDIIEDLQPTGSFELFDSRLEVIQNTGPSGSVGARWRIGLDCHQVSINPGVPLDGLSGVIRLSGQSDGTAAATAGELDLDSLFWNDLQLTNVRGPLWADGNDCFLGEGATRKLQGTETRSIEANAYGGAVRLNSWIRHSGQQRYGVAISVGSVDVTRLSTEWLQRPETLDGLLDGQLELQGVGSSVYGMTGKGAFAVSDADLYELPLFLSLLKYLRNRAPDNTAFNRLETKFTLEGEDLAFENFDLLGDAVSLYGKGTATLQRNVDLTFASIVGRNEFSVPILNSLVRSASEQLLRLRVVGPIDSPEVRREVLPMAGNVFEQLQSEFGNRLTAGATTPTAPTRR